MSLDMDLAAAITKPYYQAIDDLDREIRSLTDNLLNLEKRLSSFMNIDINAAGASKESPKENRNSSEAIIIIKAFKDELRNNNCFITSILNRLEI